MLTLSISHNIFLNKEKREKLSKGTTVECIGSSIPVWFHKGTTSEPAVEVFNKYILTNVKQDYPISTTKEGYKINMPQIPENYDPEASEEEVSGMSEDEVKIWKNLKPMSALDLLDNSDNEESAYRNTYLKFKTIDVIQKKNKKTEIIHFVEIKDFDTLCNSLY